MLRSSALLLFLLTACAPTAEQPLEVDPADAARLTSGDFDDKAPRVDLPRRPTKKGGMNMLGGQEGEPIAPPVADAPPAPEPPPPTDEDDEDDDGLMDADRGAPSGNGIKDDTADTADTGDVKD